MEAHPAKDVRKSAVKSGRTSPGRSSNREALPLWKRTLDLAILLLTFPLSVTLALLISVFIKLTSKGPLIFRQERIGLRGQRFLCLKFRTMKVNADNSQHRDYLKQLISSKSPMTKMDLKGDRRLIACGALLRATGLDELPQFINVWRGEMSFVGPRPCLVYEFEEHDERQKHRYDAVPGLTGLWQVSGKNRTTFPEMVQMDIWYAEHRSLWFDVKIIARTPIALVEQVLATRFTGNNDAVRSIQGATQ